MQSENPPSSLRHPVLSTTPSRFDLFQLNLAVSPLARTSPKSRGCGSSE